MITDKTAGWILWVIGNAGLLYIILFILLYPFTTNDSPIRAMFPETPYIFFKLAAYIMVLVLVCISTQFILILSKVDDKHFHQPMTRNFTEPS